MDRAAYGVKRPDLERLMSEHGDALLRLCYLYLKDFQLAKDALQETFLRAYNKYHTFKGQSQEKTWLSRIAINVCKSQMRRRSFSELPQELPLEGQTSDLSTEKEALENIKNTQLYEAVCALQPIYKEVILLYYYADLQISDIARALNTREGTVKTRLMRARIKLGQVIEEE